MKHIAKPADLQLDAIDHNDPDHAKTAITLDWPETFSDPAQDVIRYYDGTMFLFRYNDKYVVTDETLELTKVSDGTMESNYRYIADTLEEVEGWLEQIAEIANGEPGILPGWREMLEGQAT